MAPTAAEGEQTATSQLLQAEPAPALGGVAAPIRDRAESLAPARTGSTWPPQTGLATAPDALASVPAPASSTTTGAEASATAPPLAPEVEAAAASQPAPADRSATDGPEEGEPSRPSTPPVPDVPTPVNIGAVEGAELERLTRSFFSSPPPAPVIDHFEDAVPTAMSTGSRRAMLATLSIFLVFGLGIGGFAAYHRLVMPVPAALGGAPVSAPIPPPMSAPPPAERRLAQPLTASLSLPGEEEALAGGAEAGSQAALDVAVAAEGEGVGDLPGGPDLAGGVAEAPPAVPVEVPSAAAAAAAERSPEVVHVLAHAAADEAGFAELLAAASTLQRRGRVDEALATYHQALAIKPNAPQVLGKIALVHLNGGDNRKAQDYAARAVELDPTSSEGWIALGAALEAMGDRAGAIVAYRKCADVGTGPYVTECRRLRR